MILFDIAYQYHLDGFHPTMIGASPCIMSPNVSVREDLRSISAGVSLYKYVDSSFVDPVEYVVSVAAGQWLLSFIMR